MSAPLPAAVPAFAAALLLAACATPPPKPMAAAQLVARSGSAAVGTAKFAPLPDGRLRIELQARGLTPGQHGIHIHEGNDCSAPDAASAGGHFNPGHRPHGHFAAAERHLGDLPNLVADEKGEVRYVAELAGPLLDGGPHSVLGRALVIHAGADDYKSQPAGNSGARIACGIIRSR